MLENLPLPALRFYSYLSDRPRWGNDKELFNIGKKENVIEKILLENNRDYIEELFSKLGN